MLLRRIDPEAQHHHIEKRRIRQGHTAAAVIVAGTELQLVDTGQVIRTFQQWTVAAPIGIGLTGCDQGQRLILDAIQLHLDSAARATVGGVEYVCGQSAHGHLRSVEWKLHRA